MSQPADQQATLPPLPYDDWEETKATSACCPAGRERKITASPASKTLTATSRRSALRVRLKTRRPREGGAFGPGFRDALRPMNLEVSSSTFADAADFGALVSRSGVDRRRVTPRPNRHREVP